MANKVSVMNILIINPSGFLQGNLVNARVDLKIATITELNKNYFILVIDI